MVTLAWVAILGVSRASGHPITEAPQETAMGLELAGDIEPDMLKAQELILAPLPKAERAEFMRMLRTLVNANNELSRAPSEM